MARSACSVGDLVTDEEDVIAHRWFMALRAWDFGMRAIKRILCQRVVIKQCRTPILRGVTPLATYHWHRV